MPPTITVLIDLPSTQRFHRATLDAIDHAAAQLGVAVDVNVVGTDAIGSLGDGVVIGPGSPYRDPLAAEAAIETAREKGLPLVAT